MPLLVMYFTMAARVGLFYSNSNNDSDVVQKVFDGAISDVSSTTSDAAITTTSTNNTSSTSASVSKSTTAANITSTINIAATTATNSTDGLILVWRASLTLALDFVPAMALLLIVADTTSTTSSTTSTSTPTTPTPTTAATSTQCPLPSTLPTDTTPTTIFAHYSLSPEYPCMMRWWMITYFLSLLWVVCSSVYSVKHNNTHIDNHHHQQEHLQQQQVDHEHQQQQQQQQQQLQHRHHHQAYTTCKFLSIIIGICWIGCQHYALAFPLALIFSPGELTPLDRLA